MKKTIMKGLKLFAVLAIVFVCVGCSTKEGHITIQGIYYERSDGSMMLDASSINVDYFKLKDLSGKGKDCTFRNVPYTISNLPGNEEYRCRIVAYDKYDVEIASASVNWLVVEGFATPQTATLKIVHTHENKTDEWSYDDDQHWHEYSCRHTPIKGNHTFVSGVCSVCGYEKCNHDTDYSKYECDSTSHWHPVKCGHEWAVRKFNHSLKEGEYQCSTCGYPMVKGPSGGYVFYDCDADNDSGNADGLISSECGWRYLEAAPKDLVDEYCFGYYRASDDGDNMKVGTNAAIGTGKVNTEALVNSMGNKAYSDYSYYGEYDVSQKDFYAAKACSDYSITVDGVVYDDWFLPSYSELFLMYDLFKQGLGFFFRESYWSSTESDFVGNKAYRISFDAGKSRGSEKYYKNRVRPVRAFN